MKIKKLKKVNNNEEIVKDIYNQISDIINNNKNKIIYQINNTLVETNFMIGKTIVENELNGNIRAEYVINEMEKVLENNIK